MACLIQRKQAVGLTEKKRSSSEEEKLAEKKRSNNEGVNGSGRGKESFLKFLNEGQNGPFNKLLGAPAILLGAPCISL